MAKDLVKELIMFLFAFIANNIMINKFNIRKVNVKKICRLLLM